MTLKAARRERVVNNWVETRKSNWMFAMIDEALGKRRSCGEPSTRAQTLKPVRFVKKMNIDLWPLQIWAKLLTKFLYLRFGFTLQDHLVPMLLENFTYILNRWSIFVPIVPLIKRKKCFTYMYIYIKYTHIYIQGLFYKVRACVRFFRKSAKTRTKYLKTWGKMKKIWKYLASLFAFVSRRIYSRRGNHVSSGMNWYIYM